MASLAVAMTLIRFLATYLQSSCNLSLVDGFSSTSSLHLICFVISTIIIIDLFTPLQRLLPFPPGPLRLPIQQLPQVLGPVKHPVGPRPTSSAARVLTVPLKGAGLAEIVAAFGDDGGPVGLFTDDAGERDFLERFLFLVAVHVVRDRRRAFGLIGLLVGRRACFLPFFVQLPPLLVVFPRVQEFAAVPEPAESRLLVVFAHVGRKVYRRDHPHVRRRFHRSHGGFGGGRRGYVLVGAAAVGIGSVGGGDGGMGSRAAEEGLRVLLVEPVGMLSGIVRVCDLRAPVA